MTKIMLLLAVIDCCGKNIYQFLFLYLSACFVGSVIEWLKRQNPDRHGSVQNLLAAFCCVLGKDTLRHCFLLGGLGKHI